MLSKKTLLSLRVAFMLIALITIVGCGGSNTETAQSAAIGSMSTGDAYPSSTSGNANYYVTVSDDTILGARLSGVTQDSNVCESFTEIGGGNYSLNNCSSKPTKIIAIGGFIDVNNNSKFDTNEPTQESPLAVDTTLLSDANFTITPLSTLATYNTANSTPLATKLGFADKASAYRATTANQSMNRMMNAILCAANSSGMDIGAFSTDLSTRIVSGNTTGADNLKASITALTNASESQTKYGDAKLKSFLNDSRVQAILNGTDAISAMLAKKVPNGRFRISGLVTTYPTGANIVNNALINIYVGDVGGILVGRGVTDKYGKYTIEVNESKISRDTNVTITAQTSTLNLSSTILSNTLLDKRINGQVGPNQVAALMMSEHAVSAKTFMNSKTLLIGAQMSDSTASSAPFDARYLYLAGGAASDESCMTSCKASSACGAWWGCWQWDELPPGEYINAHITNATSAQWQGSTRAQIPVFTYYLWLNTAKMGEGSAEVTAMNDSTILTRYLHDWRFLLQKIGTRQVMIHIEPDLWGYVRAVNSDPYAIPAPVKTANPTDCSTQENTAAGFARCMISMVRKYAPNATVGLHASPWNYAQNGDAESIANFMLELGAGEGDFIVTDPSDRDAGWYESQGQAWRWWDDQKANAYLAWSKTLSERTGKPTIMWQIPLGNMNQNNTYQHYKDNRVDWLFSHINDVAASHVVGLFFGSGDTPQTNPETDGNNLINKTTSNWQSGGTPLDF